jgi:hypothetical protein
MFSAVVERSLALASDIVVVCHCPLSGPYQE